MDTPAKAMSGLKKLFLILFLVSFVFFISLFVFIKSQAFLNLIENIAGSRINRLVEIGSLSLKEGQRIIIWDLMIKGREKGDSHFIFPFIEVGFSPYGLLNRRIDEIIVKRPRLSLTSGKDTAAKAGGSKVSIPFIIERIFVNDAEVLLQLDKDKVFHAGSITFSLDMARENSDPADKISWQSETSIHDLSVHSKDFNISLKDRSLKLASKGVYDIKHDHMVIELLEAQLSELKPLTIHGALKNTFSGNPEINIKVEGKEIPLNEIKGFVSGSAIKWFDEIDIDGYGGADISITGNTESLLAKGVFSIQGKSFKRKDVELKSFNIRLPFEYQNNALIFRDALIKVKEGGNFNIHGKEDFGYRLYNLNLFIPHLEYKSSGVQLDIFHLTADKAVFSGNGKKYYTEEGISITGKVDADFDNYLFGLKELSLETNLIKGLKGDLILSPGNPVIIDAALNYKNINIEGLLQKFTAVKEFRVKGNGAVKTALKITIPEETTPYVSGSVNLSLDDAGFSSSDEAMIGEGIAMKVFSSFEFPLPLKWIDFAISSEATGFELLIGGFYGNFSDKKVDFFAKGKYMKNDDLLKIFRSKLGLTDTGSILISGDVLNITKSPSFNTEIRLVNISNKNAYNFFIRETFQERFPLLSQLEVDGATSVKLSVKGLIDRFTARGAITVDDTNIHDKSRDIHLTGLNIYLPVDISYPEAAQTLETEHFGFFRVKDFSLTALQFKDIEIFPAIRRNAVVFKEDVKLPIFGGTIMLRNIAYNDIFSPERNLRLSIDINDIDLAEASAVLKMPEFEGDLSGTIPRVNFSENKFLTEGEIILNVFNGRMKVSDLSIDNVFSPITSLKAGLEIDGIDLGKLTGTFDFGHVSGILQGYIRDLVIVNGQPESFKTSIETVKKKGISQKINVEALKKISILGTGSSSSILDRGIYRFFKEYRYKKLGFKAVLRNDNLFLRGIESKGNVGYLVKGGLLPPKVDVISYNQNISFKEIVNRLKRITQAK